MQKLYKVNLFQQFSSLGLPWTITQDGETVPLRLVDAPPDGPDAIGFLPVFGSLEAAQAFSKGRWTIDELTLKPAEQPVNSTGVARVIAPEMPPVPQPPVAPTENAPTRKHRRKVA